MRDGGLGSETSGDEVTRQQRARATDARLAMHSDSLAATALGGDKGDKLLELLAGRSGSVGYRQEQESEACRCIRAGGTGHVEQADNSADARLPEGRKLIGEGVAGRAWGVGPLGMQERHGHAREHAGNGPPEIKCGIVDHRWRVVPPNRWMGNIRVGLLLNCFISDILGYGTQKMLTNTLKTLPFQQNVG